MNGGTGVAVSMPDELAGPAALREQRDHAVGGADREQVQDRGLQRDRDRAEGDEQQQQREAGDDADEPAAAARSWPRPGRRPGRCSRRSPRPPRAARRADARACPRWPWPATSSSSSARASRGRTKPRRSPSGSQPTIHRPLVVESGEYFFTVSTGITLAAAPEDTPGSLLRDADAAMYRAKELGRGPS